MQFIPASALLNHPIEKPEYRQPCNNCGLCCRVQACHVSEDFLKSTQAPCIALEYHDGKFLCGMTIRPQHYLGIQYLDAEHVEELKDGFRKLLEIGAGCGMPDEVIVIRKEQSECPTDTTANP